MGEIPLYRQQTVDGFMAVVDAEGPAIGLALAYLIIGGRGAAPICAVALHTTFCKLPPWEQANVVRELVDRVQASMMNEFAARVTTARASGQGRAAIMPGREE